MNQFNLLLFTFFSLSLKAQKNFLAFPPLTEIHQNWEKYHTIGKYHCDTFFYTDKIDNYTVERMENLLLEDSVYIKHNFEGDTSHAEKIVLSKQERGYLAKQVDSLSLFSWADKMFDKSKLISSDSLEQIFSEVKNSKDSFDLKVCKKIYSFIKPIFFKQNQYCLFYYGQANFISKEGEFWIYKKIKTTG